MSGHPQSTETPAPSFSAAVGRAFERSRAQGRIGLVPFIPAGYPDLQTTAAALLALQRAGASVIEVGFPFSDPIADGPTIQAAFTAALATKLKIDDIFQTVASVKPQLTIPVVAMVSYSIPFRYGLDRFLKAAKSSGFDGLILPDLPPPEAQAICGKVWEAGLDTILLIAPTTTAARRKQIAELSSGFVYYLSVSGITGQRASLPPDLAKNLEELRALTDKPLAVGFGVSKPEHIQELANVADGAIVGSAIVHRMTEHLKEGPEAIAGVLEQYVKELAGGAASR